MINSYNNICCLRFDRTSFSCSYFLHRVMATTDTARCVGNSPELPFLAISAFRTVMFPSMHFSFSKTPRLHCILKCFRGASGTDPGGRPRTSRPPRRRRRTTTTRRSLRRRRRRSGAAGRGTRSRRPPPWPERARPQPPLLPAAVSPTGTFLTAMQTNQGCHNHNRNTSTAP